MIDFKRLLRAARLLSVALASVLAFTLVPSGASSAATAPLTPAPARVPANFFGVHHSTVGADPVVGWPAAGVAGSIRLWDAGVTWRQIETSPGSYDFTRLDAALARARAQRARVLLVLGQTPDFTGYSASPVPATTEFHGRGATTMPTKSAWRNYVVAVANRYGRSIDYQVWNEANVTGFWTGGMANLAKLTKWTHEALRAPSLAASKRGGKLVAPAFGTRSAISLIGSFYKQKPERYPVAKFVDAVSLQLYPTSTQRPEDSIALLNRAKRYLTKYKVNKPIYNTEVNFGVPSGSVPRPAAAITSTYQAAYASRTLVLNAGNRISRVYWYKWDQTASNVAFGNTFMVEANGYTLTAAGKAWKVTRSWLETTRPRGCTRDRAGTYTCTFQYRSGRALKRIIWNPSRNVTVKAPKYANAYFKIDNKKRAAKAGTRIRVGVVPVMIRSSR